MFRCLADSLKRSPVRSLIVALMLLAIPLGAQFAPPLSNKLPNQPAVPGEPDPNDNPALRQMTKTMAKTRNDQRQQQINSAAEKLLELAKQLDADVDNSHSNALSAAELKKADEIEKLARIVRDKMRDAQ